jgi:hypothetical protein
MSRYWLAPTLSALAFLAAAGCSCSTNLGAENDDGSTPPPRDAGAFARNDECGNGMDDDRDRRIDEGCPCAPGETQACFSGDYPSRRVGTCRDGVQTCVLASGSEWGDWGASPCVGDVLPAEETCDGADRDCDGLRDEGCPCLVGERRACGDEFPPILPCTPGEQRCQDDGTWSLVCLGGVGPSAEVCEDDVDNDCDGVTNEGCGCTPGPELCGDGIDNDCDGVSDEEGCLSCVPSPEICGDGIDQDCSGADLPCACTDPCGCDPEGPLTVAFAAPTDGTRTRNAVRVALDVTGRPDRVWMTGRVRLASGEVHSLLDREVASPYVFDHDFASIWSFETAPAEVVLEARARRGATEVTSAPLRVVVDPAAPFYDHVVATSVAEVILGNNSVLAMLGDRPSGVPRPSVASVAWLVDGVPDPAITCTGAVSTGTCLAELRTTGRPEGPATLAARYTLSSGGVLESAPVRVFFRQPDTNAAFATVTTTALNRDALVPDETVMQVDPMGRAVVAYRTHRNETHVARYEGTSVVQLGRVDRGGSPQHPDLALTSDGSPVVTWTANQRVEASRWSGTGWTALPPTLSEVTTARGQWGFVAIDPATQHPVVTWLHELRAAPFEDYTRVARWTGTAWDVIPRDLVDPAFSSTRPSTVPPHGITVWPSGPFAGQLVVAYEQVTDTPGVYVVRWDGARWVQLGGDLRPTGGDAGNGDSFVAMAWSPTHDLHIATHHQDEVRVRRWTGTSWELVGSPIRALPPPGFCGLRMTIARSHLVFDGTGRAIVAARTNAGGYAWRLEGGTWAPLGTGTFDGANGALIDLAAGAADVFVLTYEQDTFASGGSLRNRGLLRRLVR